MDRLELLEGALSRHTPPDRAASILGDLLETAQTKGRLWFWMSFTRILCSLAWRVPAAGRSVRLRCQRNRLDDDS